MSQNFNAQLQDSYERKREKSTKLQSFDFPLVNIPIGGKLKNFTVSSGIVKIPPTPNSKPSNPSTTLIKFGAFLAMLQKICNMTDGGSNSLFQFEMVDDISVRTLQTVNDDTFIVTYPGNYSSNPNKCLIQYSNYDPTIVPSHPLNTNLPLNKILTRTSSEGEKNTLSELPNPSLAMRLSDVYININFIAEVISNLRGADKEADNELDISIIDLLKGILSGVNTSLGGLNDFRIIYSEVTSQIQIISESPILGQKEGIEDPSTKRSTINTFGFNTTPKLTEGSFVTSIDLNSELTDKMATQISVGAQNNGNTLNSNATSFSTYNKGLIDTLFAKKLTSLRKISFNPPPPFLDRIEVDKQIQSQDGEYISSIDPSDVNFEKIKAFSQTENLKSVVVNPELTDSPPPISKTKLDLDDILTDVAEETFSQVYEHLQFSNGYIPTLEKLVTNISPLIIGGYVQNSNSPSPFFLPFNMSLEMFGLGGIRIFDTFSINGKGLPVSYDPSNIQLIIKSLSHTVSLEGWKTKIETLSQPIFGVTATSTVFPQSNNSSIIFDESTCEVLMVEGFDTPPSYMGVAIKKPRIPFKIRMNGYVRSDIYNLLETPWWVDNFSKGLRMLALATTIKEGYKPGSRSYKTKNPGNIGNTDSGVENPQPTLQAGLLLLLRYYEKVANGTGVGWGFGHKTIPQYFSEEIQDNPNTYLRPNGCLPGYRGNYQGQIGYFVKKYATFARVNNNAISAFSGIFDINGYPTSIDGNTLMQDLVAFNPSNTSIKLS